MLRTDKALKLADQIQIFDSPSKRTKGMLIFIEAPQSYAGIFPLPLNGFFPLVHTLGMKFPIDIVFCSGKKEVRYIYRDVRPGRFILPWKNFLGGMSFLIEFSRCDISQLKIGDQLQW